MRAARVLPAAFLDGGGLSTRPVGYCQSCASQVRRSLQQSQAAIILVSQQTALALSYGTALRQTLLLVQRFKDIILSCSWNPLRFRLDSARVVFDRIALLYRNGTRRKPSSSLKEGERLRG